MVFIERTLSEGRLMMEPLTTCAKDITRPGSNVKRPKAHSAEGILPPLCPQPPSLSGAFFATSLFSPTLILRDVPAHRPSSVVELPPIMANVGPGRATDETKGTQGRRLAASVSGTHIPDRAADESTVQSLTGKEESMKATICKEEKKRTKPNKVPLAGPEVPQIFGKKRDLGEFELYYLKEVDGDSYRPYDLRVVHSSEAGSEHYIFSPHTVLHVTERGYGGLVSLSQWHRESALWTALKEIPFFRDFRLRKAITWWNRNVCRSIFQRKCEDLQDVLVIAVPQFRNALYVLTRIIEELKGTHWLPQEASRTYTLLEFKNVLISMNQEFLHTLDKLLQQRTVILNTVKEQSYRAHQELQLHMEYAKKPNEIYEPIHPHMAHQQHLKKEMVRSESILQKLGNFAAVINQMTVQSLVTTIQQDVMSFLSKVLQREKSQQGCLFHTELCFSASSQMTVDPPTHLFQEAVSEALLTVCDSIIQMCDTCGFFLKIGSSGFAQDLTFDFTGVEHPTYAGENMNNDGVTGCRKFCCWKLLRYPSSCCIVLSKTTPLMVQGNRVHGCYYPLSKRQLEWQISVNDVTKQVEKEQTKFMQEAELEIKQLCERYSWLMDINLFISQWSRASLESMMGQPALLYEEHIKKVRYWSERINTVPSSISVSNQLFIIQCSSIKERLGKQLKAIEEQVQQQLVEQIKLHSESIVSDLERATVELKAEPQDLHYLSKYALVVRQSLKMLADTQKRLEYILSLQESVSMNYRKMTEQEETLEKKMLDMWDHLSHLLKQASKSILSHRLPLMANAMDKMFSLLVYDLQNIISKATSGPFLDPTQNAKEMVSTLSHMCAHVHSLSAELEQLSKNSQNLQDNPMDLTILTADVLKVTARKELWELKAAFTSWMQEWKQLLFSQDVVSLAQSKTALWKTQALSLTSIIPSHDAVLRDTLGNLESLSCQLAVMAKLHSPTLNHKHWNAIFEGRGLLFVPETKITVAELLSQQLEDDENFINKICRDAQVECNMEQTFQKLQHGWETRLIQMEKFTLPVWQHCEPQHGLTETKKPSQYSCNDARFIFTGLEIHVAEIENDLMTLSTMLKSPHSVEFRLKMEDLAQSLQDLGKLLKLFERYQQTWAFLTTMFHETLSDQRVDLLERFQPVDETFKEIIHSISKDPHLWNFVHFKNTKDSFHGNSLCQILIDGLSTMEGISHQMRDLLDTICEQFPRLWFLSDREVMQLLSCHPTPFTLHHFVGRCFKGIHWLDIGGEIPSNTTDVKSQGAAVPSHSMKVLGFFGSFQEHITFPSPLGPSHSALAWLCVFEKQLKLTMVQLMKQCAFVRNQLEPSSQVLACDKKVGDILHHITDSSKIAAPVLDLLPEYPLQCLLVAEEAVWCNVVHEAFQESSPVKLNNIKAYNSAKLENLGRFIRDGITGAKRECLLSKYMMMCLRALVQLTMNHTQQLCQLMEVQCVPLESSFEWLSLMKYHINSEDWSPKGNDNPSCYVDVLGHRLEYDYEYCGPEDWVMVHTPSTDRAILGILLVLISYRCGFVGGPCKKTVVQLGKAIGRQVVSIECCPSMRLSVVQRMLLGALQIGSWLVLDSVDLLTQGVLSSLGHHLSEIHQFFSELTRYKSQRDNYDEDRIYDGSVGCENIVDSDCHVVLAGKSISASLNYGCVVISSKGYTCEVPESLRCATRPIALSHPDYRIIAEVMLTSIGFSEAMSLSRHLVSLISLAKDSHCLPDFITDNQSCCLVLLQKIIAASELHLKQSVKHRTITDQAKGLAAEQTDPTSSQNVTSGVVEKHLLIIQGLMEETAIVKAVLSVLLPVLSDSKKASQFFHIFKETFPISCQFPLFQQYIEEEEKNQLKKELRGELFHSDTEIISSALTLYQTMKFSQAVMLIGPSGSGKTTCYCALAGALNGLAAKAMEKTFESDNMLEGETQWTEPQIPASTWTSVDTVVVFPNSMSHEELFGFFCEKRGWQDGAVAKVLRDSERREPTTSTISTKRNNQTQEWLVMDGNPPGQPGWLDYLTSQCSPDDPFLCLSSGEKLPSQSHLKLLMELTHLRDASPSAVTRCSLIYFTGTDLWKDVWKTEMDALAFEHKLDRETMKMWNRLAVDLFSSTLSLIRENALTSAIHKEGASFNNGLQEIMSFVRILRALLQHFGKELEKSEATPQIDKRDKPLHKPGTTTQNWHTHSEELLARDLFLVAYIWGFSGHLHPRHWPQFDLIARQVLFTCRYKIVVPSEGSVFEHFFDIDSKICSKNTLLTSSIIPKYGKHAYLMNLMLEANQPVLLAGESGSGKTTLCKTLLSFDKPHLSLPASPLLGSRDMRTTLSNIILQNNSQNSLDSMVKQQRLLLFVDDLHEAPCDVYGKTSAALETLRESISKGQIVTFDTYDFNVLRTGTVSYMAICSVYASHSHHSDAISPRLSRLFSIFVLPSLSMEVMLSIHSPQLKIWLKDLALEHSIEEITCRIITASTSLYKAVCDQFQPTLQRPHFIFSYHDIQKVFGGMCTWQPNIPNPGTMQENKNSPQDVCPVRPVPAASFVNIVHLWMHECLRTFKDRMCSEDESKTLMSLIAKTATTDYGINLVDETQPVDLEAPLTVTNLTIHTLPKGTAGISKPVDQTADSLNLPQEPKPAAQADMKSEYFSLSENNHSEEASLKTNTSQPQIIQHMEDVMAKLVYGPELSQQHNFKCGCYKELDLDIILQELRELINKKQEDKVDSKHNITTRYIVHRQRVNQLLHIVRALLIPGGHGVLIASDRGTGRKTTVRLAACVTGYQLMEVHPANENKLHEILKEARNQTRVEGVNVIILVHEGISHSAREELLVSMAHRTYPVLYTDEELRNLVSRVTAVKNSRRYLRDSWMFEKFLSQIHRNIHVFLLLPFTVSDSNEMPSNNATHGWKAQLTKALSVSCCVEVYQPWSHESLVEVAAQYLKSSLHKNESQHQTENEGLEVSLPVAMASVHQSACQYASVLLRAQPFSPQTYMEFISHFGYLYNHLQKQRQSQSNRFATALSKLEVVNQRAVQCKQNLIRLQDKVAEAQQHEKELLQAVDNQRRLLEEAHETCVKEENKLHHLEEQINHIQEQVRPVFLSSVKILSCLDPSDLEEVRHYRDPPDGVVKIMDAICLLFDQPPGWESTKQLLGQPNFFQELEFFDRYTLTNEKLQLLGQIVHNPQFVPESVREVSKACESLCRWVQAVYECCRLQHQLFIKQQLEVLAKETQLQLTLARQHKEVAYHHLEDVKLQLRLAQKELEEQLLELQEAENTEREARTAAGQLETHFRDWRAAVEEAELNIQTSPGDALILAAIIPYLGPIRPDMRTELLSKWKELCQTGSINMNPKDPRVSLFRHFDAAPSGPISGFPIPVSERLQLPLGQALNILQDNLSRMVLKLLLWGCQSPWVQGWPLLADTQQHLDRSSQRSLITGEKVKLEKEVECEMVVRADDPDLSDKLDQAAEQGLRVLVTLMERATPSPQFLDRLACPARCSPPGFKHHVQPTHPEFCLFFSTALPVQLLSSELHPSILGRLRVIDLSLDSEEIQEHVLTQLLQPECKKLMIQHLHFQNEKQSLEEKLVSEEGALMDYILQSATTLLHDSEFLPRVAVGQDTMKKLKAKIQQLDEELEYHESLLSAPRHLMKLPAALYQALQEVSRLSPAYFFSLHGFIAVMQEAVIVKGRSLLSCTAGEMPGGIITGIVNRMVAQMLVQYRPCLIKSHAAVLKLLVSLALLQYNQLCPEAERVAFLRGLQGLEHLVTEIKPIVSQSTSPLPSWIPEHIHPDLLCLEKIPAFRGLIASLSACPLQWLEYLRLPPSSVAGPVPCDSHSHLSLLQRALLWKTMVPDCLEGLAETMADCNVCLPGQTAENEPPHAGNPKALSRYLAKHEGPIILTLPCPRGDWRTSIQSLQLINTLARDRQGVKVKVICFGALCDTKIVFSMLDKAVTDGHWLVFNNCHLLEQWDDNVVAHLNQLISSIRDKRRPIHPSLRLWFITQEYASYSIPGWSTILSFLSQPSLLAVVRLCALPLICDSPWDLKEELSFSLQQLVSNIHCQSLSRVTEDNMELLLRCATFHSVLLQRQTYKYLGQGIICNWSQDDLLTLMDAYIGIASPCHDKTKALQYIAVNLVHGGHVLDASDLKVVESVAKTCLSRVSDGGGPQVLSNVISNPCHFDLTRLLQIWEQHLQDSDHLVLGFSADVAAEMTKINSHNLNILLQASQNPLGTTRDRFTQRATLPDHSHARERLQTLKRYLAHESNSTNTNAGAACHGPLRDFLQAEWDDLIDSVSSLLSQLQQPVQYSTPTFASLLKLTHLSNLERRAELLGAYLWHKNTSDPPGSFRLTAFKNARGFLVAVMTQTAQIHRKNVSDIALQFEVLCDSTYPASFPLDAVYLCGLELRGGSWDEQLGAIQDTVSLKPCSLPLVCVKAQVRSTHAVRNISPCNSSHVGGSDVQVAHSSPSISPQLPLYQCPLCVEGEEKSGNWGLADVNIITTFPLRAKLHPVLCSLRRVRLVSVL